MKKKMMVYLGLITMISSFFVVPISAVAESLTDTRPTGSIELPQQNQVPLFTEESSNIDKNKLKTSESEMESSTEESLEPIEEKENSSEPSIDEVQKSVQQSEKTPVDDSSYANLTLELDPPREGNKFFTGERIQFYQTIKSSSEQLNKEPYSLIEISREFVDKESIKVHADQSIKSYEILDEKPNTWTIRINYKAITSGGIVSVPISFNQRNYTTAPNSETTISSSLYFEEILLSEDSLSVYAETIKPKLKKEVHTPEVIDGKVEIGLESENKKGVSSSNDAELKTVMYELTVTVATSNGYGVFVDSYGKIVDKLPKEAKFVNASSNTDYDEKTHTVSFSIPENEKPVGSIIWKRVYVNFPNTKEIEPILNEAELKNRSEDTVVAQASATFIPTLGKRDIYIVGGLSKTVQGKKYGRYIGEKPDDIVWDVSPTIKDNPYNKDAYIKEIEDIVDNQQEYSKVKLSIPNNVEYDAISLYGAKKDSDYQLIQEKVLIEEEINLTNDLSKIKIVFNKPVKYSKNIKLYVTSKVKENLWTSGMDAKQVKNTANVIYSDPEGNVLGSGSAVENVNYEASNIVFSTSIDARKKVDGHVNDVKSLHYRVDFTNVKDGEEAFIVTLLPNGVKPIPDSEKFVVINNYLNTGKVAVLQKVTNENNKLKTSNLPIKITGTLGKGEHQIQHYIYWEHKTILPKTEFYSYIIRNNILDFDKLGTYVGRNIVGDTDRINNYPPLEVMVLKRIGTSSKNLSEVPIEISDKDDIYYEINLENRTNQAIENYYFYDVLPFPGDKVSDQKNGSINNSRGSNNSVTFSEIVSKDDNLDLYYSSETNIDNLKTASWQKLESSTPVNQIKSIKAVPTIKIEANQNMSVIFKVRANEMNETSVTKNAALLSQKNQNVLVDSNTVEAKNIKPEVVTIKGIKTWEDEDNKDGNRPEKITVNLLADGIKVADQELTQAIDWKFEFKDQPKFKNHKEIDYTVEEVKVPHYETTINANDKEVIEIVNRYKPEKIKVAGIKTWKDKDNKDGNRPEKIIVNLLADGIKVADQELTQATDWKFEFKDLVKEKNHKEINYTIEEEKVRDYDTNIDDTNKENIQIVNIYNPETTIIEGVKTWEDKDDQDGKRPESITVNLLANGKEVDKKEVTAADNWTYKFEGKPKYQNNKKIVYTVTENQVPEYQVNVTGFNITNTYTPGKTSITVTKEWNDQNNQDGKRPENIRVQLLANGKEIKEETLYVDNNWQFTWIDLPQKEKGKDIEYTVTESQIPEYSLSVDDKDKGNIKLTNTYLPKATSIKISKVWEDNNNQYGMRPTKIVVNLLANDNKVAQKELTAIDSWQAEFKDLPKFKNGIKIDYKVEELRVPHYTSQIGISDEDKEKFEITNTYNKETTLIEGNKIWKDNDNELGNRPEKITVNLLANGQQVAKKDVTEADAWHYEFTELPKYQDGKEVVYTVTENSVEDYTTEIEGTTIINHYKPGKTSVTVTKQWEDKENQDGIRPKSIQVQLLANNNKQGEVITLTAANKWSYTWGELNLKEKGKLIAYTVEELSVPGYEMKNIDDTDKGNIKLVNKHTPEMTFIEGVKVWDDENNQDRARPETVTVNLLANGHQINKMNIGEADNWSYRFDNLPKFQDGIEILYTVTEDQVQEYQTSISGFDITNTHTPGKTSVTVTKSWEDDNNQDGIRPDNIRVQLLANGKVQGEEVNLIAASGWSYTWNELNLKDNGENIDYTIKEVNVPGYTTTVDTANVGNIKLVNTHISEKTVVKGSKTWKDNDNQDGKRPDKIIVNLLADGEEVDQREVTESTSWVYEFANLPKYQNGQEILYTVTENQVPEYQTSISGYDITNTYMPGKTSVTVTKQWEDNNNQDGIRPNTIKVQLLANGEKLGDVETLSPTNNWQFTWNELAEKEKGKEILYTIKEIGVSGYQAVVDATNRGNIKLLNRYIPEVTSVKGSKTWKDNDNQDGKRPEKITVNLLADGKEVDQKEVTKSSDWNYEFTNLPKYQNGLEISYTVTENQVPEYQTSISGYDITNTYSPGKTSVTVTKQWEDNNNQDGIRPERIQVQLLANGNKQEEVVLSVENKWSYTWNDLNQKEKGKDINYTIEEVKVPGYVSTVDTTDKGNIKLVNTHLLEKTAIKGNKIWKDNDNKASKRPEKITVNLLADGKQVTEKEVTNATEWRYEFTDLPKYQNGLEIVYTVTENQVPEYQSKISGFDITNTYTPGKTSVTVTKEWLDNNDKDKTRPDSIKVQLLANGEKQGEVVVITKNDKWRYTWSDLAMVDDKEKSIRYTVTEVDVPKGYTVMYKEAVAGNLSITNSHTSITPKIPNKIIPPTTTKTGGVLPKTGEERVNWMPLLGLAFIVLTSRVVYIKRKEN